MGDDNASQNRPKATPGHGFGGSGRKYSLSRQIGIVSSSGTFANREVTSKEHIISLPCFVYDLAKSAKVNESSTVCWLVDVG